MDEHSSGLIRATSDGNNQGCTVLGTGLHTRGRRGWSLREDLTNVIIGDSFIGFHIMMVVDQSLRNDVRRVKHTELKHQKGRSMP